jgi:catechol 2,3-dioxygenase-like lactoylglutathione lyase family enzyme
MAITGTHALLYTSEPEAVRAIFRDVLGWPDVDAGGGWLIFGLPPAELGVHPAEPGTGAGSHAISFMCDDINATIADLEGRGLSVDREVRDEGFGLTTLLHLPGGVDVMLYEPRHPTAI